MGGPGPAPGDGGCPGTRGPGLGDRSRTWLTGYDPHPNTAAAYRHLSPEPWPGDLV